MSRNETPRARILTPKLTDHEYRQLREAARMADTTSHQYTAALIRAALQEDPPGVAPEGSRA